MVERVILSIPLTIFNNWGWITNALPNLPVKFMLILLLTDSIYAHTLVTTGRALENIITTLSQVLELGASGNPPGPH
eukprot:1108203-Pelagomonas_calceolata.AAC.1